MAKTESDTDEEKSAELLYTRFSVIHVYSGLFETKTKAAGGRINFNLLNPGRFALIESSMNRRSCFQFGLFLLALFILVGCSRSSGPRRLLNFKVEFGDNNIPGQMTVGRTVTADITITNTSKSKWPSKPNEKGQNAVNLSYHWFDRKGAVVVFDGLRTALPNDVRPGESVQLKATIQPPDRAGQYSLEVTLVQEAVAWFPERDGGKLTRSVNVIKSNDEATSASDVPSSADRKAGIDNKKTVQSRKKAK